MIREACPTLAPQRREHIRLLVRESGIARVEDLRRELKVSVATIRRDLEVLEEEGKVRRVHGGAVSTETRLEEAVLMIRRINLPGRNAILQQKPIN